MTGAVKHMERSHRSYKTKKSNAGFSTFAMTAYSKKLFRDNMKARKMTLGQKLSASLKKLMPQKREG